MWLAVYFYGLNYIITISQYIVRNAARRQSAAIWEIYYSQRTNKQHYSSNEKHIFYLAASLSAVFTAMEEVAKNKQREPNNNSHSLAHMCTWSRTKNERPLNKCSMSSIPVNLFRMWSVRPIHLLSHALGPGISMEFRWMDFMCFLALSVQAAITRCFLWPNYFGWHDKT